MTEIEHDIIGPRSDDYLDTNSLRIESKSKYDSPGGFALFITLW